MSRNYRSELVGAFGCPIDENPTGVMEEAAFRAKDLDFRYLTIKVGPGDLEAAMAGIRAMNFRGINLTIPHKVEVLKYLDELSEAARIIGAVNMVVNRDGKLWGENTDGKGFLMSLENAGVSVAGKTVLILGAGGASRAISVECALAGAKKIYIVNRNPERGGELVQLLKDRTAAEAEYIHWVGAVQIPTDVEILVNGTCVGLFPDVDQKPEMDYDTLRPGMVVSDVIFNDPNSLFLREAERRGAQTVNGLGMLVNQGALNFTLWTGAEAPVDVMMDTLKKEFNL